VVVGGLAWGQRNVPEAICGIAFADDDNVAVFVDLDVILCEKGNTIVVTELTD
jgi:mannitol/fructose-specific phosphotransferase system IIA component